jgi:hypothetical protein
VLSTRVLSIRLPLHSPTYTVQTAKALPALGGTGPTTYEFYAQSDGTCKYSSISPNYTYPSPIAIVYNDNGWYASVTTSMTSIGNGGGGGIDSVDSKVRATIVGYGFSASAEVQIDCEYNTRTDQSPGYLCAGPC